MGTHVLFDATLYAYVAYCLEFCVRYFALAGGLYWLLHVYFKERCRAYRIQSAFPDLDAVRHEIVWSMANTATTGLSTLVTYRLIHTGHTQIYFTVVGEDIRFGLAAIKNVGEGAVEAVLAARREGGAFASLFDLCDRVDLRAVNRRVSPSSFSFI